jgi:hypothetical protein
MSDVAGRLQTFFGPQMIALLQRIAGRGAVYKAVGVFVGESGPVGSDTRYGVGQPKNFYQWWKFLLPRS